jgi:hypothetical protein
MESLTGGARCNTVFNLPGKNSRSPKCSAWYLHGHGGNQYLDGISKMETKAECLYMGMGYIYIVWIPMYTLMYMYTVCQIKIMENK